MQALMPDFEVYFPKKVFQYQTPLLLIPEALLPMQVLKRTTTRRVVYSEAADDTQAATKAPVLVPVVDSLDSATVCTVGTGHPYSRYHWMLPEGASF
jgi:hypothetical protein